MGLHLRRNRLLKTQGRNLWKVLKDAHTHAFLTVIQFAFTKAWLQPRAAASQASSPQTGPVQGKRPGRTQAWALLSSQCPPRPPSPGQVWLVQAFLPAEFLSFQESGCTLTHLLPLEIRWQQGPCVYVSVGPRDALLLASHVLCAFYSSSCIYPFALHTPHLLCSLERKLQPGPGRGNYATAHPS